MENSEVPREGIAGVTFDDVEDNYEEEDELRLGDHVELDALGDGKMDKVARADPGHDLVASLGSQGDEDVAMQSDQQLQCERGGGAFVGASPFRGGKGSLGHDEAHEAGILEADDDLEVEGEDEGDDRAAKRQAAEVVRPEMTDQEMWDSIVAE